MTDVPPSSESPDTIPREWANRLLAARQDPIFNDVSDAQAALLAALAKASRSFDRIGKEEEGQSGGARFKYADLATINRAIRSAEDGLAANGIAVMQPLLPSPLGEGWTRITTIITGHGATISFPYDVRLGDLAKDALPRGVMAQKMGAVISYMRRYLLSSALNLEADKDLDALNLGEPNGKQKQDTPPVQAKPAAPKPQQRSPRKQPPPRTVKPAAAAVAKPVVAKPTVVTTAVAVPKVAAVPDEPSAADNEETPDFSMREPGDDDPGQETQVTILEASAGQKAALSAGFKRHGIRQRSKIDALISGVVPGQNAKTILENAEHAQAVIDSLTAMENASNG